LLLIDYLSILHFLETWITKYVEDFTRDLSLQQQLRDFLEKTVIPSPHKTIGASLLEKLDSQVDCWY